MINFNIPTQFMPMIISGEYIRYGALIKSNQTGQIIGHLKEAGNLSSLLSKIPTNPIEAANFISSNAQLLKIQDTLNSLQLISTIGTTASVLNLGITIAGFAVVINKLNRMENKLDSLLQSNKEIENKLNALHIKSEFLLFAKIKTAFEKISIAEITEDSIRKKLLLNESSSDLREIKNYYDLTLQNINKINESIFTQDHLLTILQRYFSVSSSIIQIEFMLEDFKVCKKDITDFSKVINGVIESTDLKRMWFTAGFDEYKTKHSSILDYDKLLETAKKEELEKYDSILKEELARVESLEIELDYFKESGLTYKEYVNEIKALPDGIILIPKINERRKKMEESNKSTEAMKAGATAAVGAGVGYGVVAASGITAIGAVGSGAGFGSGAGPVGAVVGACLGLAAFGIYKIFK